jgi:hypothetical protein
VVIDHLEPGLAAMERGGTETVRAPAAATAVRRRGGAGAPWGSGHGEGAEERQHHHQREGGRRDGGLGGEDRASDHPRDEVADEDDGAHGERGHRCDAGLDLAVLLPMVSTAPPTPLTAPSITTRSKAPWPEGPRPAHEGGDRAVVAPGVSEDLRLDGSILCWP